MKKHLFTYSIILFILFLIFTLGLTTIDVVAIGPNQSMVGFSRLNQVIHSAIGVNMTWYHITDWMGLVPIAIGLVYGFVGLIQWIRRRKILLVDPHLLVLGLFYIIVFLVYLFFEFVIINYRPILINGYLEASYPSSTTMLACTFLGTSIDQTNRFIRSKKIKFVLFTLSIVLMIIMVGGRIISGVHWISDIIGSLLLSGSLLTLYYGVASLTDKPKAKNHLYKKAPIE